MLTKMEFEKFLANKGAKICNNYNLLARDYSLYELSEEPVDQEAMICQWLMQ